MSTAATDQPHGVQFEFKATGNIRRVFLAGDFNSWASAKDGRPTDQGAVMNRGADGLWEKSVSLGARTIRYKFITGTPE